jgi:hypothetical protein
MRPHLHAAMRIYVHDWRAPVIEKHRPLFEVCWESFWGHPLKTITTDVSCQMGSQQHWQRLNTIVNCERVASLDSVKATKVLKVDITAESYKEIYKLKSFIKEFIDYFINQFSNFFFFPELRRWCHADVISRKKKQKKQKNHWKYVFRL